MNEEILSSDKRIIFATNNPVLFSILQSQLGLSLEWGPWKPRIVEVKANGYLIYRKINSVNPLGEYDLTKVEIEQLESNDIEIAQDLKGLRVKCRDTDGYETSFRLVISSGEFNIFSRIIRVISEEHNLDSIERNVMDIKDVLPTEITNGHIINYSEDILHTSTMRRAVARAMDLYDVRTAAEKVIARRGTFHWLPVMFSSDLVHGAWWFVLGSFVFLSTAIVLLVNEYKKMMGDDDSALPNQAYVASLILMIISGFFSLFGSMAFVRALQQDPPVKPLFASLYHIQSDELLGSWSFLLGAIPMIPYSLMYLSTPSNGNLVSICALIGSLILVFSLSLLVKASYPSTKPKHRMVQPIAYCLCFAFCSSRWMRKHLCNDWLVGCWFLFWTTVSTLIVLTVLFTISASSLDLLNGFIYGTGLLETLFFLIGSAYFVAGSYPAEALLVDIDDSSITSSNGGRPTSTIDFSQIYSRVRSPAPVAKDSVSKNKSKRGTYRPPVMKGRNKSDKGQYSSIPGNKAADGDEDVCEVDFTNSGTSAGNNSVMRENTASMGKSSTLVGSKYGFTRTKEEKLKAPLLKEEMMKFNEDNM